MMTPNVDAARMTNKEYPSSQFQVSEAFSENDEGHKLSSQRVIAPTSSRAVSLDLDLDELTINKLQFSSLGLYGRDDEVSQLERCFYKSLEASKRNSVTVRR